MDLDTQVMNRVGHLEMQLATLNAQVGSLTSVLEAALKRVSVLEVATRPDVNS